MYGLKPVPFKLTHCLTCYGYGCAPPGIERKLIGKLGHFSANALKSCIVVAQLQGFADPGGDDAHFRLLHAASGERRRAYANARGLERRIDVVRNGVLVDGDAGLAKSEFGLGAENSLLEYVDEHEVVVGASGDDAETGLLEALRQNLGVGDDLRGVGAELRAQRFGEGHGLGGNDVNEGPALLAGKDCLVNCSGEILPADNEAGARATQRLVCGGGGRSEERRVGEECRSRWSP